jgi:hypothetical protein
MTDFCKMSEALRRIQTLVLSGDAHVSEHGYDELRKDDILVDDAVAGVATAVLVETIRIDFAARAS